MKQVERKVFGQAFLNNEPSDAAEYDQLAKKVGACVEDATDYTVFHCQLGAIRGSVVDLLEERFPNNKQKTEKRKNGEKEKIVAIEKDADYLERLVTEGVISKEDLSEVIKTAIAKNPFDPSVAAKEGKPKKLPDDYKAAATHIYDQGKADRAAKKFGITLTGDRDKDIEAIGWKIRDDVLEKQRKLIAKASDI